MMLDESLSQIFNSALEFGLCCLLVIYILSKHRTNIFSIKSVTAYIQISRIKYYV